MTVINRPPDHVQLPLARLCMPHASHPVPECAKLPRFGGKVPMGSAALSNAPCTACRNRFRVFWMKFWATLMRGWKLRTNVTKVVAASFENLQVGAGS